MNDRIYFEIKNSKNEPEKMELLSRIKLEKLNKSYILYKNCDDTDVHYYAAAYDENDKDEFSNLDTNLSDNEKQILNEIFHKIVEEGIKNA